MRATATRSGHWWAVEATFEGQPVYTQAKRLDQVADMVRDAFATLDLDVTQEVVEIIPVISGAELADAARSASKAAAAAAAAAAKSMLQAVRTLQSAGLSVRDVAAMLDVSPQRVSQISTVAVAKRAANQPTKGGATRLSPAAKTPRTASRFEPRRLEGPRVRR